MPIYVYECLDCFGEWKESHGMHEEIEDCSWCGGKNIHRKPSMVANLFKKTEQKKKIGDLTNEFIENSMQDLRRQKEELDKNR